MSTVNTTRISQQRPVTASSRQGGSSQPAPSIDPFRVLRKHLHVLLLASVFAVGFGVVSWVVLGKVYPLYTGSVYFEIKAALADSDQVVGGDLTDDDVVVRLSRTEAAFIIGPDVLYAAVGEPAIAQTDWAKWFTDSNGQFQIADAVDELTEDLVVRYIPDTNLFEMQWAAHKYKDVPTVLNTISTHYLRLRKKMEEADHSDDLDHFNNEENELNRELKNLQDDISAFVSEYSIFTLEDVRSHPLAYEVVNLNRTLAESKSTIAQLTSMYDMTAAKLVGEIEPTEEDYLSAENHPVVLSITNRIADLKIEQRRRIVEFGPEHKSTKELDTLIIAAEDEKEDQLQQLMSRNLNGQLKAYQNSIESYNQMVEELKVDLSEKDEGLTELASRVSEYESLIERRENMQYQLQSTRELITEMQRIRLRSAADRIRVLISAREPRELSFPLPEIIIPLGFLLVMALTVGVIFIRELTDKRIKSAADLSVVPGAYVLGVIPDIQEDPTRINKSELAVRDEPHSVVAESYRQTCTPIIKAMELKGHQSLLVVGGLPGSGTTTVVSNLAAFIAAGGRSVLAIDGNFRRPGLAEAMDCGTSDMVGLGDVLVGKADWNEAIINCSEGIDVIAAGSPANRIFERLSNGQFEVMMADLRSRYDFILIDAPPAVVAGDAQILANKTDASVLVAKANQEQRGLVARLIAQFTDAQCDLLGIILNRPRWTAGGYFKKNFATMAEYAAKASE